MNALVLAAAAGEVDVDAGRWSLQPGLVCFGAAVLLLAGFYLGRISDDVHRWWLWLWGEIARYVMYLLVAAGAVAVVWVLVAWWPKHKGG